MAVALQYGSPLREAVLPFIEAALTFMEAVLTCMEAGLTFMEAVLTLMAAGAGAREHARRRQDLVPFDAIRCAMPSTASTEFVYGATRRPTPTFRTLYLDEELRVPALCCPTNSL